MVLGGLFREALSASRGQVPVLGNIPILGVPFRQTSDETQRSETIVLITPHIINDDTALYDKSEKEAEDVHRMMLGNRADLQPWSRDRVGQLWYTKAQEQLEKGNKDKAIMYTDWALNAQPQFIEAIKLREKLSNQKMEEASQSAHPRFCAGRAEGGRREHAGYRKTRATIRRRKMFRRRCRQRCSATK